MERLDGLSDADLDALEAELVGAVRSIRAGEVPGVARDDLDTLSKLRDAVTQTREAVKQRRSAKTVEQEAAAAALEAEILGTEGEPTQKAPAATKAAAPTPAKAEPGGGGLAQYLPWGLAGFVAAGLITALVFIVTGDDGDGKKERAATTKPAASTSTSAATTTTTPATTTTAAPALSPTGSAWLPASDVSAVIGNEATLTDEPPNQWGGSQAFYDVGAGAGVVDIRTASGAFAQDFFQTILDESQSVTGDELHPITGVGTEAYNLYPEADPPGGDILVRVGTDRAFAITVQMQGLGNTENFNIAMALAQRVVTRLGG